jgi:ribosomal protein S18 acetylase RimI-like enzyme
MKNKENISKEGVLRMRRMLNIPFASPAWSDDIHLVDFNPDLAKKVHDLLTLGYKDGGGSVPLFSEWWSDLVSDDEFDPSLCFIVSDYEGIVGVAQVWTSAFVKDFVIHPRRRKQGIGKLLLLHTFCVFRERGAQALDLKVRGNNPSAISFYLGMGMEVVEHLEK